MQSTDQIFIREQRVTCHVGVPDEERAQAQELVISTSFSPSALSDAKGGQGELDDDIASTIDYHAVSVRIDQVAAERPRKLIETLAEDLACMVITEFGVSSVTIEIEKMILPNTRSVGVVITRKSVS